MLEISIFVIIFYLIMISILFYIVKRTNHRSPFQVITGKNILMIISTYVGLIFLKGILLTLMAKFYHQKTSANDALIQEMINHKTALLMVLMVVILVPITEELLFRGLFTSFFFKNQPFWQVSLSGVIFGLMHSSSNPISALLYISMGWILAFVYVKTKNLSNSLMLHILNNAPFMFILLQ